MNRRELLASLGPLMGLGAFGRYLRARLIDEERAASPALDSKRDALFSTEWDAATLIEDADPLDASPRGLLREINAAESSLEREIRGYRWDPERVEFRGKDITDLPPEKMYYCSFLLTEDERREMGLL
jgi:hypothetical protein